MQTIPNPTGMLFQQAGASSHSPAESKPKYNTPGDSCFYTQLERGSPPPLQKGPPPPDRKETMPQRDRHRDQMSWPYRRPALQLHVATPPGNYKPRRNISSHMNKSEHHSQPIGIIHRTEASTHQTTTHAGHVMQHTGCHWLHQVCLCAEQRIVLATTAAVAPALSTSSCSLPLSQARRKRTKPWVVCLQACVEHRKQQ
jgi:hypothetical protein